MNEKEHLSIVLYKWTAKTKWTQTQIDIYFRTQALFFPFAGWEMKAKEKKQHQKNKNEKRERKDRKGEKGKEKKKAIYKKELFKLRG